MITNFDVMLLDQDERLVQPNDCDRCFGNVHGAQHKHERDHLSDGGASVGLDLQR